jgi:hypothetical protein
MMNIQSVEVAYLPNTDLAQQVECAEKECPVVRPLITMNVWKVWREPEWKYFAFCTHDHALRCLPANHLPKG